MSFYWKLLFIYHYYFRLWRQKRENAIKILANYIQTEIFFNRNISILIYFAGIFIVYFPASDVII